MKWIYWTNGAGVGCITGGALSALSGIDTGIIYAYIAGAVFIVASLFIPIRSESC